MTDQMKKAVCVLIENPASGKVLCVSRGTDLNNWGLPGGKVEDGETFREAAVRELVEETGLVMPIESLEPIFAKQCIGAVEYYTRVFRIRPHQHLLNFEYQDSIEGKVEWREWEDLVDENSSFRIFNENLLEFLNAETEREQQRCA